jgi:hypothetical protein
MVDLIWVGMVKGISISNLKSIQRERFEYIGNKVSGPLVATFPLSRSRTHTFFSPILPFSTSQYGFPKTH